MDFEEFNLIIQEFYFSLPIEPSSFQKEYLVKDFSLAPYSFDPITRTRYYKLSLGLLISILIPVLQLLFHPTIIIIATILFLVIRLTQGPVFLILYLYQYTYYYYILYLKYFERSLPIFSAFYLSPCLIFTTGTLGVSYILSRYLFSILLLLS